MTWLENILHLKLITPKFILYWWIDYGHSVHSWEEVFWEYLRGPCTFEIVDLENWPRVIVGTGVQVKRVRMPEWCERVVDQIPSVWNSREVMINKEQVLRHLVSGIGYIDYTHNWNVSDVMDNRKD